jgi:serine phosphatase RsbU (regulator of sigma subunit)
MAVITESDVTLRHPVVLSLAAGLVAFATANAAESALIAATGSSLWTLELTSDLLLSCALVATTYLWLHLRSLKGELSALERSRVEIDTELRLAARIQRNLLDATEARPAAVAWHATLEPARTVGGDFYDVITLDDWSALILIADVSGKGIPAAIALASARAAFRLIAPRVPELPALAAALSRAIYDDNGGSPYMTAILCRVDPARDRLRFVNAGHPTGRLVGRGGLVRLESTGPPLGLLPNSAWEERSVDAEAFDLGLLFTDGVIDAVDGNGDADAVFDAIACHLAGATPAAACAAVMDRVHRDGPSSLEAPDDRTVLAFVPRGSHV